MDRTGGSSYSHYGGGDQYNANQVNISNIAVKGPDGITRRNNVLRKLKTSPYKDRKDQNPQRTKGACKWVTTHQFFKDWERGTSSRMLWISADPGCGKSVLARYMIDTVLPTNEARTTCYFFFKDDFEDQRSATGALCCMLHKLFLQKDILFTDRILNQFEADNSNLTNSFAELWDILISVAEDTNAGEIVCIFDAFDECDSRERNLLSEALSHPYRSPPRSRLKILLTTRPYGEIRRGFRPLDVDGIPVVHLSGEGQHAMEQIGREIDIFITAQVEDIGLRLELRDEEKDLLLSRLTSFGNRTYLWVYLTLDLIKNDIRLDRAKIDRATSQLPRSIDEAYDRILSKTDDPEEAKKLLHIIAAASKSLSLEEVNLALSLREHHRSYSGLGLQASNRFQIRMRDLCGLFVRVVDNKIYLLHQTAEFLVPKAAVPYPKISPGSLVWKHTLQPHESHGVLAKTCMQLLLFLDFEQHRLLSRLASSQRTEEHVFLAYSANN